MTRNTMHFYAPCVLPAKRSKFGGGDTGDLGTGYSQSPTKLHAEFNPAQKLQKHRIESLVLLLIIKVPQPVSPELCNYKETCSVHKQESLSDCLVYLFHLKVMFKLCLETKELINEPVIWSWVTWKKLIRWWKYCHFSIWGINWRYLKKILSKLWGHVHQQGQMLHLSKFPTSKHL